MSVIQVGGAVAEWSKVLQLRENKWKPKSSLVCPLAWSIFKKYFYSNIDEFQASVELQEK